MENYRKRIDATRKYIIEHEAVPVYLAKAKLSLELHVKPERIEEYLRTLGDASEIIVQNDRLYTMEQWDAARLQAEKDATTQELKIMAAAKETGMEPLENFSREDS